MHAWEAIQKSVDYIEENLSEDIKIENLANLVALSPYYFQRLFKRLVKKTVNEYLKLRRLAKASENLKSKDKRIIDIAYDCGFSDHANFTRAFKVTYGITPEQYRDHPVILNQFVKPDLILNYVMIDEDVPLITEGIVIEITRRKLSQPRTFLGITGEVPIVELSGGQTTGIATIGGIWDEFHRQKPNIPHFLANGNECGILYMGNARDNYCSYLAGAETSGIVIAEGYTGFTFPCGEYLLCCFEAENFAELIGSAVFKASSFMDSWIKKHGLIIGDFAAEIYYGTDHDSSYMEQWLPLSTTSKS